MDDVIRFSRADFGDGLEEQLAFSLLVAWAKGLPGSSDKAAMVNLSRALTFALIMDCLDKYPVLVELRAAVAALRRDEDEQGQFGGLAVRPLLDRLYVAHEALEKFLAEAHDAAGD